MRKIARFNKTFKKDSVTERSRCIRWRVVHAEKVPFTGNLAARDTKRASANNVCNVLPLK